MCIRYINAAVFMIWSLTYHNSMHIDIEIDTTRITTDLQKPRFTKFYHMDQLWWKLYNRESVVGLTDVNSNGRDIEKVWCAGA